MRPILHPRLTNDPFGDPGLFIPFLFDQRALMIDLGDIERLSTRDLLKVSHVFVTHTHMDHFAGFDRLLRIFLGRNKRLHLFGPLGFLANIEGKLAGYTWNLVGNFTHPLVIHATEVRPEGCLIREYPCAGGFQPRGETRRVDFSGVLVNEPALTVHTVILDHGIPCLGFCVQERFHVNILKPELDALDLTPGPWIQRFKVALYAGADPATEIQVGDTAAGRPRKRFLLGELAQRITRITPGQRVAYVADVAYNTENAAAMVALARGADHLYIEAAFLDQDRSMARKKAHLTARQAGIIAARAGVRRFSLFHFSPRYSGRENALWDEARAAFESGAPVPYT